MARAKKSTTKGEATDARPAGKNAGVTSGLKKGEFLLALFKKQAKDKLTDEQLAAAMGAEFPDAKTDYLARMGSLRNCYNKGQMSGQDEAPAKPIPEFGPDGKPAERRKPGPKGQDKSSTDDTPVKKPRKKKSADAAEGPAKPRKRRSKTAA